MFDELLRSVLYNVAIVDLLQTLYNAPAVGSALQSSHIYGRRRHALGMGGSHLWEMYKRDFTSDLMCIST